MCIKLHFKHLFISGYNLKYLYTSTLIDEGFKESDILEYLENCYIFKNINKLVTVTCLFVHYSSNKNNKKKNFINEEKK